MRASCCSNMHFTSAHIFSLFISFRIYLFKNCYMYIYLFPTHIIPISSFTFYSFSNSILSLIPLLYFPICFSIFRTSFIWIFNDLKRLMIQTFQEQSPDSVLFQSWIPLVLDLIQGSLSIQMKKIVNILQTGKE